jgi:thymidylate synthase ThyX
MTERVTQINLVSFANYQRRRNDPHAQPEIQFVAREMLRLVKECSVCPVAISALEEIKWRL